MEIQPSLLNLGLGVGFLPGMIYDKFGPTVTSLVGLVVSVGSYMLLWSTIRFIDFYKTAGGLMAVYFMICGKCTLFLANREALELAMVDKIQYQCLKVFMHIYYTHFYKNPYECVCA